MLLEKLKAGELVPNIGTAGFWPKDGSGAEDVGGFASVLPVPKRPEDFVAVANVDDDVEGAGGTVMPTNLAISAGFVDDGYDDFGRPKVFENDAVCPLVLPNAKILGARVAAVVVVAGAGAGAGAGAPKTLPCDDDDDDVVVVVVVAVTVVAGLPKRFGWIGDTVDVVAATRKRLVCVLGDAMLELAPKDTAGSIVALVVPNEKTGLPVADEFKLVPIVKVVVVLGVPADDAPKRTSDIGFFV